MAGVRGFTMVLWGLIVIVCDAAVALPMARLDLDSELSNGIEESSFVPARQGLIQLDLPMALLNATAMVGDMSGACSGTYISDEGHMLLASHCLETCYSLHRSWGLSSVFEWGDLCEAKIGGRYIQARVVAMLKCPFWSNFYARAEGPLQKISLSDGLACVQGGDLAVIQVKSPPTDFTCLPLKTGELKPGDEVFTIGRPMASARTSSDYNSDGKELFLSTGKVVNSATCEAHGFQATWLDLIRGQRSIRPGIRRLQEQGLRRAQAAGMVQTTVDILPGSSGGALVTSSGEVAGVASFILLDERGRVLNSRVQECSGSTFFEPITHLSATAAQWGEGAVEELTQLKCVARRVRFQEEVQVSSK